jgi:general secretion pathway protein E
MNHGALAIAATHEMPVTLDDVLDDLVADGVVAVDSARMLRSVVGPSDRAKRHPLQIIADRGWDDGRYPGRKMTLEGLTEWFAEKSGLPLYRIDPLKIDVAAVTSVMSYAYASRFGILALEVHEQGVVIGTAQPWVKEWQRELERLLGRGIQIVILNPDDISRYSLEFYSLSRSVSGAVEDHGNQTLSGVQNLEQMMELSRSGKLDANDQHVVNIVDWLLQYAYEQRASDIHLEPRRKQGNVRFRIDGVMHTVYQIPSTVMAAVTSRIKILGRMDVAEKRKPQDGRLKTRTPDGKEVELRLSTMPTAFGEKLVMRIFDPEVLVKDYSALGFGEKNRQYWQDMIHHPNGIILVTGPTGSGKTTTLYTTLNELARPEVNICTVEDPIELVEPKLNQMQVQHNIGLDFASGIRTLLRQDPDIIMVGEIRDLETAEMAIQAALTGHLVFSTLHTNDAASAITRLLEIGVAPYLLKATLLGVLAQRLVRTLCPHCKAQEPLDADLWQSLVHPWKVKPPESVYKPVGCLECRQTGFRGRLGVYELLPVTDEFRRLIGHDSDLQQLRRRAVKEGMRPMRLDGAHKIAKGETTIDEVLKVAPETIEM